MAVYRLSAKAASDLDTIYEYTILRFGLDQARVYLFGLQEQFQILAEQPAHGRQADALARGLRRWEYQSHIIFYMPAKHGIRIVRVLHQRMDARRHV